MKRIGVFAAASLLFLQSVATLAASPSTEERAATSSKATKQIIGDWVVACEPRENGRKSCAMMQTLASAKLNRPVGVLTIGKDASGRLRASIRLPVGVSLPAGVAVAIDGRDAFTAPYSACHRIGCFAPFDVDASLLGRLRTATRISAVAQSLSKQSLNLNFSARGFPAAYDAYAKEAQ